MPSTYSSNLKIELMSTGENSGTWGNITNTNLGTAMEQAVVGYGNPDYTSDANLTITLSNSNAAQAARALVLNVTSAFGSLTATRELVVPTSEKQYIVQNNTTGGQSITVKTSAGTGITVPNGRKAHLYVDGTNVIQMFDFVDINGGAIDGTTIGASSASTGAFTTLNASGATTLDGNVTLGNASGDNVTVTGTITSNLLFTDNTYDIGASGATRPRNLFLAGAATIGGNLSVGGTLTLTGGVNLNGNVTVGDASTDTLTINSTITSNLIFTDNTYDIGASGATRPRNLFLAGSATISGSQTLTGALTVDSTTDSSSTTTGSIQTDGGLGVAKALFVGTTANIAGAVTLSGGTANGVAYLDGSKVLTTGSALTFDGTNFATTGTASATKLIPTGGAATGNGMYLPAANTLAWSNNGSETMRLDSSGNLGLGVTPSAWDSGWKAIDVSTVSSYTGSATGTDIWNNARVTGATPLYKTTAAASFYRQSAGAHYWFNAASGTAGNAISFTQAMTLDASGRLVVGATSTAAKFQVSGVSANTYLLIDNAAGGENYFAANISNIFQTAGTERARIDSSGNLLVGTTSITNPGKIVGYSNSSLAAARFVGGSSMADGSIPVLVDKFSTTNTTSQWFLGFTINNQATASGVITANGASQAAFGSWSDRRLKENIVDLPPQLDKILALRPVEFDYIESEGGGHQISFIAQEFEEIYPDAVGERPDGMKTLTGWSKTEARLVKAIQEQQAIINAQTTALNQLKADVAALKGA